MINIQRRPSPYPHPSGTANFQAILNSPTPRGGRVGGESNYCPHTLGVTHMGQFGTMGLTPFDTWWHRINLLNSPRCPYWTMPVQDPWGQGESRGVFCRPRHVFLVSNFLRQLCRRCSTTCFLQKYHFFAHSPRGAVGGWWCWCCLWLSHVFLQVLRLLSHKLLARAAAYTQFRLFVSVLTSAPLPRLPPFLH